LTFDDHLHGYADRDGCPFGGSAGHQFRKICPYEKRGLFSSVTCNSPNRVLDDGGIAVLPPQPFES